MGENKYPISPDVILLDLDLRLPDLEKNEAMGLLELAKKLAELPKPNKLAWPAIEGEEIKSIEAWCDGKKTNDDRAADKALLLLLPRLLAMALPLTPIILFSATGRTWIKETLKPYQNIITGFEKPRVLSNPEAVESSITALHEALDKAVKMIRLRLQLAHAQEAVKVANKNRQNGLNAHHIEIYADEGEEERQEHSNKIVSGLAVCVFGEAEEANKLQSKLECEHRKGDGVVWAKKKNDKNDKKEPQLKKGSDINEEITLQRKKGSDINNIIKDQVELMVCKLLNNIDRSNWSVTATRCEISQPQEVSLASFPDAALDAALCFNLEFSLFVLIPYLSEKEFQGEIHIHLPTRVLKKTDELEQFANAFGLYINKYGKIRVWPEDSGFPLVRGWLAGWGDEVPLSLTKVKSLKMTSLGLGTSDDGIDEDKAKNRRLFHDIADWVCTASLRAELKEQEVFKHWHISDETDDTDNAKVLMQALRASSQKDSKEQDSDMLRLLRRNTYIRDCEKRLLEKEFCSQQRLILWALRKELQNATGPSLHLLVEAV